MRPKRSSRKSRIDAHEVNIERCLRCAESHASVDLPYLTSSALLDEWQTVYTYWNRALVLLLAVFLCVLTIENLTVA